MQETEIKSPENFWTQKKTIIALAISLLALAEIVDLTIVAVAIPQIMGAVGANIETIADVTTIYIVAAAICILLSGLVIEKYGMKRVALVSAIIFGVSSALCGISTSLTEMIIFRGLQGIGGAFLPSLAQAYISTNFKKDEFNKMMAVYSMVIVMGPILGPVLGGAITENMSWRWIFYVNVPICLVAGIMIFIMMDNTKIKNIKIDYISFGFMAIGIGCLELFVDNGNTNGWFDSIEIIILLAIAIIGIGFFLWRGITYSSVIKLSIFKNLNFVIASFLCFTFVLLFSAAMAYLPTMLQQIYNYPVDLAGYITAPRGVAAAATAIVAQGFLIKRIGCRTTMSSGMVIFAISSFMQAHFSNVPSEFHILTTTMLQGVGMMLFFIPLMQMVTVGIKEEDMGDMSGAFNFFRNFGGSVGTAFVATIISRAQQVNFQEVGNSISALSPNFQAWSQSSPFNDLTTQVAMAQQQVLFQSSLMSYLDSFYIVGLASLGLAVFPFFLKEPPKDAPAVMGH
ncbi:MDR family MFS transporter [Francisella frigiditurris]|uniref:Drug resistance MFS transporter, drug:H+ antiporter-2 family protein n=1 Tax=Francisella frigiditurris TaxID=1542390 RepID=A0A1J0KTM2_9GAMM|nr:MDR family MFS transporter [Francisella frigiditurris]APC97031.1 drug resistance MFS transporter, drug:H+ antiporter-2 family protein [Francisella frigiditurris]